jgi:hypothetical protein
MMWLIIKNIYLKFEVDKFRYIEIAAKYDIFKGKI